MNEENLSIQKNRTPLSRRPVPAVLSIIVLYVLTEIISDSIVRVLVPDRTGLGLMIKLIVFSFFAFFVIPLLLRLPAGKPSLPSYFKSIGLKSNRSLGRSLFLAFSCYIFFILSQTLGSLIFHLTTGHRFALDYSRHGLLDSRSIIPAIFEETILRGVIVAVLMAIFAKRKAILISAGIFAGLHLLNMLNPDAPRAWVLCQVIWAFGLGVMYAYMLVEWRSLVPLIILHYLINALVGVWFGGLDTQTLTSGLYGILFFGLFPAALAMVWVKYLSSRWPLAEERSR